MCPEPASFDVVIVGGGPAGSSCAMMLARAGARVGLVHRGGNQFSRVELVSGRARRLIKQHCPFFAEHSTPAVEIDETISLWGTPEPVTWSAMYNPWGSGLAVERAAFDEGLRRAAKRAGASIIDCESKSALRRDGRWQLVLDGHVLKADFLVLAGGSKGRKLLRRKAIGKPAQFALIAQVGSETQDRRKALFLELGSDGWWYMLPNPLGGYFAGFCSDYAVASKWEKPLRSTFVKSFRGSRLLAGFLSDTLSRAPVIGCPAGPRRYEQVTGDGWIAVGDAAFVTDPLSGQGLEFAIDSSVLAVGVLADSGKQSLKNYEDAIHQYAVNHELIRRTHLPAVSEPIK